MFIIIIMKKKPKKYNFKVKNLFEATKILKNENQ